MMIGEWVTEVDTTSHGYGHQTRHDVRIPLNRTCLGNEMPISSDGKVVGNKKAEERERDVVLTPIDLLEHLVKANGGPFDLDPCSPRSAHVTEEFCKSRYTIDDDGLKSEWFGTVFCNPPYSKIEPWIRKAWESVRSKKCDSVAILIPYKRNTNWWNHTVHRFGIEYLAFNKKLNFDKLENGVRVPFRNSSGVISGFPDNMVLMLVGNIDRFHKYFSDLPRGVYPIGRTLYGRGSEDPDMKAPPRPRKQIETEEKRRKINSNARTTFETNFQNSEEISVLYDRRSYTIKEITDNKTSDGIRIDKNGFVTHINGKPIF